MADKLTTTILAEFNEIRPKRQVWDGHWQDIKELVRCDTSDFNRKMVQGYRRYDLVYDGVAIHANEELACGLCANLVPATDRWFEFGVDPALAKQLGFHLSSNPEALAWLETVADIIYAAMTDQRSNFNPTMMEAFLDLGSFGTAMDSVEWDVEANHIVYKSYALAQCYFVENSKGRVDKVYRYFDWTGRKIIQEYGEEAVKRCAPKLWQECDRGKGLTKEFKMLLYTGPRGDRIYGMADAQNKKYASVSICETTQECILDSGFDENPFVVSRWVKLADEVYGRGPAMKCLPDLKSLQAMAKVMLKAGQKAVDPPIVVPDDGFILPIKTSPGSIIFKEPGAEKIETLDFKGNIQDGQKQIEAKREYIGKCFYSEWLKRFRKNREQSATEVEDDRDEMMRMMSPMLGRQQSEHLGPLLEKTYSILHKRGMIPPAPAILQRKKLCIIYTSPAARAQQSVKADRMSRVIADTTPMAQVNPDVWDAFDLDQMAQEYAMARGVPRGIMRSKKDIMAIRKQKAQAQQMQQMAQTAEPASNAIKNIAQAHQAMGGGQSQ